MDMDERTRASIEMPISSGFLDELDALITAWSEVRVLPGSPLAQMARDLTLRLCVPNEGWCSENNAFHGRYLGRRKLLS